MIRKKKKRLNSSICGMEAKTCAIRTNHSILIGKVALISQRKRHLPSDLTVCSVCVFYCKF